MFTPGGDFLANHRAGKLRILAFSGRTRLPFAQDVATALNTATNSGNLKNLGSGLSIVGGQLTASGGVEVGDRRVVEGHHPPQGSLDGIARCRNTAAAGNASKIGDRHGRNVPRQDDGLRKAAPGA
jgi:hypothetical protein